jgi:hypothetical protein
MSALGTVLSYSLFSVVVGCGVNIVSTYSGMKVSITSAGL